MRAASRTEFLDRKFVGLRLLILAGRVVARLAGVARKRNQISHCNTPRKKYPSRKKPSRKIPAPLNRRSKIGAHDGIRTRDLFLTKEVLYRLSYMGITRDASLPPQHRPRMERETGFEPATPSLEGSRSTN